MDYLFPIIIGGWAVSFIICIIISHFKKYNNLNFYNVSDKIIRFKRVKNNINTKNN